MSFPLINVAQFFDSSGSPLASGTIEFRDPTDDTYINTYPTADKADSQTDANANPLTLNARGEAATGIYLEDGVKYKITLREQWPDEDTPGTIVWTQDDVLCPIALPYLQTSAESAAGVTPTNVEYPPGDVRRYANITDAFACGHNTITLAENTTYTITAQLTVPSNTTIQGHGPNSIIQLGANITALELDGVSNVTLKNFKLDGVRATYTTTTNDGISSPANGTGSSNVTVENVEVVGFAAAGIIFLAQTGSHSDRITIKNCYVYNNGAHGIICQDYIDNTIIENNYVEDFGMLVSNRPGITTGRFAKRHVVRGNIVISSSSALGTSPHGISLDQCDQFTCADNIVENCIGYGIEVVGCIDGTVSGNSIEDGTRAGITIHGTATNECSDIAVTGNSMVDMDNQGILLQDGAGALTQDIAISGNVIKTAGGIAIQIDEACEGITVTGNNLRDAGSSGVYTNLTNHVVITGNTIKDCNTSASASHAGIRVINTALETDFLIEPNAVSGSGNLDYLVTNPIKNKYTATDPDITAFTAADATPSIALGGIFTTADTTTYTDFDDGLERETFKLLALHAAIVKNNANIKTSTAADKTLTVNVIYMFTNVAGVWYESATA